MYRNKLNNLVRTAEKKYYDEKFLEAANDMKKLGNLFKILFQRINQA